jgi:hypothetical protein
VIALAEFTEASSIASDGDAISGDPLGATSQYARYRTSEYSPASMRVNVGDPASSIGFAFDTLG